MFILIWVMVLSHAVYSSSCSQHVFVLDCLSEPSLSKAAGVFDVARLQACLMLDVARRQACLMLAELKHNLGTVAHACCHRGCVICPSFFPGGPQAELELPLRCHMGEPTVVFGLH